VETVPTDPRSYRQGRLDSYKNVLHLVEQLTAQIRLEIQALELPRRKPDPR
jgi:hypothetical protein